MTSTAPADVFRKLGRHREIDRLRSRVDAWVARTDAAVRPMLEHQFQGLSKYFRPLTIFGCHYALSREEVPERVIVAAQAIEMIHNVTLVIDDIVDGSNTRRSKPTLHPKWDTLTAYMVAGYVVADTYDLLASQMAEEWADLAGVDPETARRRPESAEDRGWTLSGAVDADRRASIETAGLVPAERRSALNLAGPVRFDMRLVSELIKRLSVAECVQWESRKAGSLRPPQKRVREVMGIDEWRYLAREDTGCMFEICAVLGARSQRFRRFGRLLGMLYHGCDDVADVKRASRLGGGGEEDLRDGILTLPAALALEHDPSLREVFRRNPLTEADERTIANALTAQIPAALEQLDLIEAQAADEAMALAVPNVEALLDLIVQARALTD